MKHNLIFALLASAIILLGMTGSKLMYSLAGGDRQFEQNVKRSSFRSGALYFADRNDFSFEPMSSIRSNVRVRLTNGNTDQDYIGDCPYSDILLIMLRYLSSYSEYTTISSITGDPVVFRTGKADEYFAQGIRYKNPAGEDMNADIILRSDLSVRYVRFYSDDGGSPSTEDIQLGARRLVSMTENLFAEGAPLLDHSEFWERTYAEIQTDSTENVADAIEAAVRNASSYTAYNGELGSRFTPLASFLLHTSSMQYVSLLIDQYYSDGYDTQVYQDVVQLAATSYVANEMLGSLFFGEGKEYSSDCVYSDGRIYETVRINTGYYIENVVLIYNVSQNVIEGIFSEPEPTIW